MISSLFNSIKFKTEREIEFPQSLKTDKEGFDFLADLYNNTNERRNYKLNFKNVNWFEANLCAVLGAIILTNKTKGASFEFINLNNDYLNKTLINNGFLNLVKGIKKSDNVNSGIPFQDFDLKQEQLVEEYIYNHLLLSNSYPNMSGAAKRKIYRSIFEIYQNSIMHSEADKIFVCGQFYYSKKRIALTMVDIGKSFKQNVTDFKKDFKNYTGKQCIEWAVESGNTTKKDDETGGLGLEVIRKFLVLNGGKLQIRSADGYWEEKKGVIFASDCENNFWGSIVNIEFNLNDKNTYITNEDIDPNSLL